MNKKKFKIVLHSPDIPGNTGSIGRTCVALDIELILIKPIAFDISEKAVRRAGLDYWKFINLRVYENWEDFLTQEKPENMIFLSKLAKKNYFEADYAENCYLIFGSETKGLPDDLHKKYSERFFSMPMFSENVRSLNLSNAATAVAYECLRQLN
ncbi:MAG: tRNA (cytidine(34)-2'-O)-methyltransferase [Bacteriovoracaceae bacterium]|nr:tRNA (cytidine(34)-2'-O)-methyltransferase [Bacteriovoracaceae bacterium]